MTKNEFRDEFTKFSLAFFEKVDKDRANEYYRRLKGYNIERLRQIFDFMINCDFGFPKNLVNRVKEVERHLFKDEFQKYKYENQKGVWITEGFFDKHMEVQAKLENEKIPTGVEDIGFKSMGEVFLHAFKQNYIQPAWRQRQYEKKIDRLLTDAIKNGNNYLCYYCQTKILQLYDREKSEVGNIVMTDIWECPKCKIRYT